MFSSTPQFKKLKIKKLKCALTEKYNLLNYIAGWITGCDAAELEQFNFQFRTYSGKHGVRLKPDSRADMLNQRRWK